MNVREVLGGGGVTGAYAVRKDWSRTAVGPIDAWPESLKMILGVMFRSSHAMSLYWGPEMIQFYNDAYLPRLGTSAHPAAMGQRVTEGWPELWSVIGEEIETVRARGRSFWREDQLVPIHRDGRIEDVYWTFGCSPVFAESGIGGVLLVVTETTLRVTAQRRLVAAQAFAERVRARPHDVASSFSGMAHDVPFAVSYSGGTEHRITGSCGLAPEELERLETFLRGHAPVPAATLLCGSPLARADVAPEIFVAPLAPSSGFVVLGTNPRIRFDDAYRSFLEELVQTLADAMAEDRLRAEREASLGALAAGMAHEINNPLTFITANLELVLQEIRSLATGSPSSRFQDLEDMIVDARTGAERVARVVRGLQTFSRPSGSPSR